MRVPGLPTDTKFQLLGLPPEAASPWTSATSARDDQGAGQCPPVSPGPPRLRAGMAPCLSPMARTRLHVCCGDGAAPPRTVVALGAAGQCPWSLISSHACAFLVIVRKLVRSRG